MLFLIRYAFVPYIFKFPSSRSHIHTCSLLSAGPVLLLDQAQLFAPGSAYGCRFVCCSVCMRLGCRVIFLLISHQATVISLIQLWLQVLFALHDATLFSGMQLVGVTTKAIEPIHTGSSKVDIFLELYEASYGSVAGQIEYDSSLWKRSSINAMAANLLVRPGLFFSLAQHTTGSIPHLQAVLSVSVLYVCHVCSFPCQCPSVKS